MDLKELAQKVHALAKDKGWHSFKETDEEFVGRAGNNLHGEISELWESYRRDELHKPCDKAEKMAALGIKPLTCAEEECADIVIRELDSCQRLGITIAELSDAVFPASGNFVQYVTTLHACATAVSLSFRDAEFHARLLAWTTRLSQHLGFDLWDAVERKHQYNCHREYRHGGKVA